MRVICVAAFGLLGLTGVSAAQEVTAATSCAIVASAYDAEDPAQVRPIVDYMRERLLILDAESPPPSVLVPLPAGDARDRAMSRALAMFMLSQFQRKNPADSRTAKMPCPPETLTEMGFSPAMVAALTRGPPPLV